MYDPRDYLGKPPIDWVSKVRKRISNYQDRVAHEAASGSPRVVNRNNQGDRILKIIDGVPTLVWMTNEVTLSELCKLFEVDETEAWFLAASLPSLDLDTVLAFRDEYMGLLDSPVPCERLPDAPAKKAWDRPLIGTMPYKGQYWLLGHTDEAHVLTDVVGWSVGCDNERNTRGGIGHLIETGMITTRVHRCSMGVWYCYALTAAGFERLAEIGHGLQHDIALRRHEWYAQEGCM